MTTKTRYRFNAIVELIGDVPDVDCKTGAFSKADNEDGYGWTIMPTRGRRLELSFCAYDSLGAIEVLNRIMQRCARSRANPKNYREKRSKYGPKDYKLVQLVHPATGQTDLPTGENPDMSPRKREKGPQTEEMSFT